MKSKLKRLAQKGSAGRNNTVVLACFVLAVFTAVVLIFRPAQAMKFFRPPPMLPPEQYGNLLIDLTSTKNKVLPVTFSHWTHRRNYTCEVCHTELEIEMILNSTEMNHENQKKGLYCGACHNGLTAFSHQLDCEKCHKQDPSSFVKKYNNYVNKNPFPTTEYGNQIDWVAALERNLIAPRRFLKEGSSVMSLDRTIEREADTAGISSAVFPHKAHLEWMGCDMCHPDVFTIKTNGTDNLTMAEVLNGRFCGKCHLGVAFPLNNCNRCHPGMGTIN